MISKEQQRALRAELHLAVIKAICEHVKSDEEFEYACEYVEELMKHELGKDED